MHDHFARWQIVSPTPLQTGDVLPTPDFGSEPWRRALTVMELDPGHSNVNAMRLFGGTTTIVQWDDYERHVRFDGGTWYVRPVEAGGESETIATTSAVVVRMHRFGEPLNLRVIDEELVSEAPMAEYRFADGSVPCSVHSDDTHP